MTGMEPEDLLARAGWVRRLCLELAGDAELGEDAAQDALLAAWRRAPRDRRTWRAWLARVARNAVAERRRDQRRRLERERRAARPEALPDPAEAMERAALRRVLVDAVLALEDPYAETVVLRYFEELAVEDVARAQGVAPSTVRTRLERARARLRARLAPHFEGRGRDLHGGLLWLAGAGRGTAPAAPTAVAGAVTGGLWMSAKIATGAVLVAALAGLGWWALGAGPAALEPQGALAPEAPTLAAVEAPGPAAGGEDTADGPRRSAIAEASAATPAGSGAAFLLRVLSRDGHRPVEGALVRADPQADRRSAREIDSEPFDVGTTDARGELLVEAGLDPWVGLWVRHPDYFVEDLQPYEMARGGGEVPTVELVLSPLGVLTVTVLGPDDEPLEGAVVSCRASMERGTVGRGDNIPSVVADEGGVARFERVPCGAQLRVVCDRGDTTETLVIDPALRAAELVLRPAAWASIVGTVLEPDGAPARDLTVSWVGTPAIGQAFGEGPAARTDDEGAFALRRLPPSRGSLRFARAGAEPLALELAAGEERRLDPVTLPALARLAGRVVGPEGLELGGYALRVFRGGRPVAETRPDGDGRFEVALSAGPVEVLATHDGWWDEEYLIPTGVAGSASAVVPADDVELRVGAAHGRVRGRLDADVAGARVELYRPADPRDSWQRWPRWTFEEVALDGGRFLTPWVPAGTYDVRVAPGEEPVVWTLGVVVPPDGTVEVTFPTPAGTSFAATVTDRDGLAGVGATVHVGQGQDERRAVADASGQVSIDGLEAGPALVWAELPGTGVAAPRVVDLAAAAETTLVLEPYAHLSGVVLGPDGPQPGARVGMQRLGRNHYWKLVSEADGRFAFEPLPAGAYRLYASGHEVRLLRLAPGEQREVQFDVGAERVELELLEQGAPLRLLDHAELLVLDPTSAEHGRHYTARVEGPGRLSVRRPDGPALLAYDRRGPSTNRTEVVWLGTLDGARRRVAVDEPAVTVVRADGAYGGPPLRVLLEAVGGVGVEDVWKFEGGLELAWTRDAQGRQVLHGLPDGARVRVQGVAGGGLSEERELTVRGAELHWE